MTKPATLGNIVIDGTQKKLHLHLHLHLHPLHSCSFTPTLCFATTHDYSANGYFNWREARDKFSGGIYIDGRRYRLPSREELGITAPDGSSSADVVRFSDSSTYTDRSENPVRFRGTTYSGTYTDIQRGNPCYALRFKGGSPSPNALLSAYRYRWTGSGIEVTSILLGPAGSHTTLSTISNESYWNNTPASDIATLFLPASGYYNSSSLSYVGSLGDCWSSTEHSGDSSYARHLGFGSGGADVGWSYKTYRFPVRLLLD